MPLAPSHVMFEANYNKYATNENPDEKIAALDLALVLISYKKAKVLISLGIFALLH